MAATTLAPLDELHEREVAFNVSVCVRANESVALAGRQGYKLAPHLLRQMDHVTITLHPPSHPCVAAVALSVPLHHSSTHSLPPSLPALSLAGLKRYLHPCYLTLTGPQSDYTCLSWLQVVCACVRIFGELMVNNPLHIMWHLFKLIQPQITIFFMGN